MNCLENIQLENINSLPLATAFVANQKYTSIVSPEKALEMGTAWQELYMPEVEK